MHVFRWDLDRTYLDTDIHSMRGLLRTAFEAASDKRTLPGAASLLRALVDHDPSSRVHVLSGSPKQMRKVLLEKLAIDGVQVDSLTLKDNLGNIRRGRLRAVRGQIGYKLPRLLKGRRGLGPGVHETLFGDDSESDALIYAAYAEAIAGRLSASDLARVLEVGGAYSDSIDMALNALDGVGKANAVDDIFIRVERGTPISAFSLLGRRVIPVFSWWQAAMVLQQRGRLSLDGVMQVAETCAAEASLSKQALAGLLQDAFRRGLVDLDAAVQIAGHSRFGPLGSTLHHALRRIGDPPTFVVNEPPDYVGFLRATKRP
jgi:hypothetical protein